MSINKDQSLKENGDIPSIQSLIYLLKDQFEEMTNPKMIFDSECIDFNTNPDKCKLIRRHSLYLEFRKANRTMINRIGKLSEDKEMPISQENGQRRFGPPKNYDGPPPERGCEVFIGKIPRDMNESDLIPILENAGRIYDFRLMMDFNDNNRGYAFCQYFTYEEAQNAIATLNEFEIRPGKFIGVVKSIDNCRLFFGGIPRDKTKEQILTEILKLTEGATRVILNSDPNDRSKNRGYAFIEYRTHKAAAMARRKMIPGKIPMFGVSVAVDWADPEPDVDPFVMSKVQNLFVRNLHLNTTEDDLTQLFNDSSNNGVEKVKKIKDYAFIHFLSRHQAEKALRALEGHEFHGMKLEVTWAKPVNRNEYKAKKATNKKLHVRGNSASIAKDGSSQQYALPFQQQNRLYSRGIQNNTGTQGAEATQQQFLQYEHFNSMYPHENPVFGIDEATQPHLLPLEQFNSPFTQHQLLQRDLYYYPPPYY